MASTIQLDFVHLCEYSLIDMTGKLSLIGLFENFNFQSFPVLFPKFTVVATIRFATSGKTDYPARVVILNPDGTEFGKADYNLKSQGAGLAVLNANFVNREFRMPGEYAVEIWVGDKRLGHKAFTVTLVEQTKK
jgi:hypothetical protein